MAVTEHKISELAQQLGNCLNTRGMTLATAESCTGGWIAKAITDLPGSSLWFEGSVVSYSNHLKQSLLGVSKETLEAFGAVSSETVKAMTEGIFNCTTADVQAVSLDQTADRTKNLLARFGCVGEDEERAYTLRFFNLKVTASLCGFNRSSKHCDVSWIYWTVTNKQSKKRLFIALWPDDETRRQICQLQQSLNFDAGLSAASPVDENHIHITLHFLGSVHEQEIPVLTQALENVSGYSFEIDLDRLGYFSKPNILWLGSTDHPEALNALHKTTGQAVKKCLPGYQQKKLVPHVTLFRKAMQLPQKESIETIRWQVDSFVLVESKTYQQGVQYRVLQRWLLN